jgi:ABC-type hemin transport system substrate-binding protein
LKKIIIDKTMVIPEDIIKKIKRNGVEIVVLNEATLPSKVD